MQQQSHKRPLLFAEATKFNKLQFARCNCLLLNTGHTVVHRAGLETVMIVRNSVHWADLRGLLSTPLTANAETCSATRVARQKVHRHLFREQLAKTSQSTTKYPFETITISSLHICRNAKTIQVGRGRRHLSQVHLLEEVSLAGAGLRHLPAGWQGHVVGNLVRRLTQVLRRGARWDHTRQGASRNGPQLQGGRGGVRTDVVRRERAAATCIGAGLDKKRRKKNNYIQRKEKLTNAKQNCGADYIYLYVDTMRYSMPKCDSLKI